MSKVIAFHYYCDNWEAAKHKPNQVEADTVLVYSPKQGQVVEMDVCDPCLDRLRLPEITDLADRMGREIEPVEYDTDLICPFGCNKGKPYKSQGGKARHMTVQHPEWEPQT